MSEEKRSERFVGGLKMVGGQSILLAFTLLAARVVASENLTGGWEQAASAVMSEPQLGLPLD